MMTAQAEVIEDLECRATRKIRLFAEHEFPSNTAHFEWLVCSSKFGIGLAVLPNNQVLSYQLANIHSLPKSSEAGDPEILDLPSRKTNFFQQEIQISFVRLSCNQRVVAFGADTPNGAFVYIFDIFAFSPVTEVQPFPLATVKASSGNGKITCLEWNPEAEDLFTVGTTDGSLVTIKYSLDNRLNFSIVGQITMPNHPTCLCWSPKGKQLSVGDTTGRLHQLKPELTHVRHVDAPQQIQGLKLPVQCAGLFWLANTDWLIVYRQRDNPIRLSLALMIVKKNQPPVWSFFGDLTFQRPNAPGFLDTALHFVPLMQWNMVLMFAHRSPDFAIVGQRDGNWVTFVMEKYNITMPTNAQKSDTYPIGASFDLTSSVNVTLDYKNSEAPSLPPQPMLHILSSGGLLLPYNICSLDNSRPNLIINPSNFSAQNVMNGPQPANYQAPQSQQAIKQEPISSTPIQIQPPPTTTQQVATQQEITNQSAQPPVIEEQDLLAEAQAKFENTLVDFAQTKGQLINDLEALSAARSFLNEKSNTFDIDCIDSLWELSEKVHASIDDGIQTVDKTSRKSANLIAHLRQSESIWQKHLLTGNQRKRNVIPSSLLEDLTSIDRRIHQAETKTEKLEKDVDEIVEECNKKDPLDSPSCTQPENSISFEDQERINKVNDAIAKKVAQFSNRVLTLQQQLKFLKVYSKSRDADRFGFEDPSDISIPMRPPQLTEPVGSLANDIKRLLLIVDGKAECSPFTQRFKHPQQVEKTEKGQLNSRQVALKNILDSRTSSTQIRRVCPKKLIVDETPVAKSTPLRTRMFAANNDMKDQQLKQQMEAAKQTIAQAKANAVQFNSSANSSFGTIFDSATILSAIKLSADAIKSTQPAKAPAEIQSVAAPTQQQTSTQAPETSGFSFASMGKTIEAEQKAIEDKSSQETPATAPIATSTVTSTTASTPSNFSFKKDDAAKTASTPSNFSFAQAKTGDTSNQPQATSTPNSFSFAQKKEDGELSSAFGGLSATGNQPAVQTDQSKSTPVSFSFTPKPADAQQTAAKPTNFSFNPQQTATSTAGSSPFNNVPAQSPGQQSGGPVSFSFAPKADTASQSGNAFGGTGFNQQQSNTGFGGENKSAFGGNAQTTSGSAFGSGFSSFSSQNKPNAFGSNQQSGFGSTQQQSSGFGSSGFGSTQQQSTGFGEFKPIQQTSTGFGGGPSFGGAAFSTKPAFGSATGSTTNANTGFGSTAGGFSAFANKGSSFGQLAQQAQNQPAGFGSSQQPASPFGSGFGSPASSTFGSGSAFGSAFNTPQQPQSSAFTAFRK